MNKHTIPIPLQGTSKLLPLGKWGVVSSALLLAIGQNPCLAQTVTAPPGQTPAATQQATPDVASELDAMKKRIEQLESELNQQKKDKEKREGNKEEEAGNVAIAEDEYDCSLYLPKQAMMSVTPTAAQWTLDSGATKHFTGVKSDI